MSDLVPTEDIERIVGIARHPVTHYGRAVSAEGTVYVLHSQECLDSGTDLRDCRYSLALDEGIDAELWDDYEDMPVILGIYKDRWNGRLIPLRGTLHAKTGATE